MNRQWPSCEPTRDARLVDDLAGLAPNALALEEGAVVVAAEEARLLALGSPCRREPRGGGLRPRLVLRLLAEREAHALEERRIDGGEHVRLVLLRVGAATDESHAVPLDDASVVTRPELVRSGTVGECHELVEAKRAVAAHARIRRLPVLVCACERIDDRALEVLAHGRA